MLDRLERKFGRYAVPNIVTLLVVGQAGSFILSRANPSFVGGLVLVPSRVLQGEVWRLVTFLFVHPTDSLIFIIFALYLLYLYGRALEEQWGAFRLNVFLLVGWAASILASFVAELVFPGQVMASNIYLSGSIFLAFAYLFPNFELLLFFVLPVKIKWLALLTVAFYVYQLVVGTWVHRGLIVAGTVNLLLFFGPDVALRLRGARRRQARRAEAKRAATTATHRCEVCGRTDLSDPELQFRYCSRCSGKKGYCLDHIRDHEHR